MTKHEDATQAARVARLERGVRPLVEKLRERKQAVAWSRGQDTDYPTKWEPDALCQQAADEIARLRADAERYRWLEEHCTSENDNGDKCLVFWCDFENYNDVDAAIDAARAALKEKP